MLPFANYLCYVQLPGSELRGIFEFMAENGFHPEVVRLGLPDKFVEHGTPAELYHIVGIDKEGIKSHIS